MPLLISLVMYTCFGVSLILAALFISGPGNNNNNNNKTWTRFRRLKQYDQVEINRCDKSTFEYCLSKMQDVMQNSSLAFPTNIDDLELTCR